MDSSFNFEVVELLSNTMNLEYFVFMSSAIMWSINSLNCSPLQSSNKCSLLLFNKECKLNLCRYFVFLSGVFVVDIEISHKNRKPIFTYSKHFKSFIVYYSARDSSFCFFVGELKLMSHICLFDFGIGKWRSFHKLSKSFFFK